MTAKELTTTNKGKNMIKSEFVNDSNVTEFISFLANYWETGNVFEKGKFKYLGIKDAFHKYYWTFRINNEPIFLNIKKEGNTFEESQEILSYLKDEIQKAFKDSNEEDLFFAIKAVLAWGGPRTLGSEKRGNWKYLKNINSNGHNCILEFLTTANNQWEALNSNNVKITSKINFRSNSGFTKIFSLFLEDFVIYDSRVGAAFTHFLSKKFGSEIPNNLILNLPNGSEKKSKYILNSNPAIFKSTSQNDEKHFSSNVKASWIIKEVIELINKKNISEKVDSRQFEAALFMIGADVSEGRMN